MNSSQAHRFFKTLEKKSILSNLHSADLQKRQPNVAPHLDESFIHHFCFFFHFALNRPFTRWGRGVFQTLQLPFFL